MFLAIYFIAFDFIVSSDLNSNLNNHMEIKVYLLRFFS